MCDAGRHGDWARIIAGRTARTMRKASDCYRQMSACTRPPLQATKTCRTTVQSSGTGILAVSVHEASSTQRKPGNTRIKPRIKSKLPSRAVSHAYPVVSSHWV